MPLGIFEEAAWDQGTAQLEPGHQLVLYTDGVTDAINTSEALFGKSGLMTSVQKFKKETAEMARDAILEAVHTFVGDAPQFDDITLMVIKRD